MVNETENSLSDPNDETFLREQRQGPGEPKVPRVPIVPSIRRCHCLRCHRDWWPRQLELPRQCSSGTGCGSLDWNKKYANLRKISISALEKIRNCPHCVMLYPRLDEVLNGNDGNDSKDSMEEESNG